MLKSTKLLKKHNALTREQEKIEAEYTRARNAELRADMLAEVAKLTRLLVRKAKRMSAEDIGQLRTTTADIVGRIAVR